MFNDNIAHAIIDAAKANGIEPAALLAIVEVETGGKTFEQDGRTPQFLYERHVAYKEAKKRGVLAAFQRAGLAIPHWSRSTQYKDERTSQQRLALMGRACGIDEEVAKSSASWGLGQTMGFLAREIGFKSAVELVEHQTGSIAGQIDCMVRELKHANIVKFLNAHNWAETARRYNGAGYAQNHYDIKLRDAWTRWTRKLPQLHITVDDAEGPVVVPRTVPPEQSLDRDEVRAIQRKLLALGFKGVGATDGRWGTNTTGALSAFQAHSGLPHTGHYDKETQQALDGAIVPRPVDRERTQADADDLREAGSVTIEHADKVTTLGRFKKWAGLSILGSAGAEQTGLLDQAQSVTDKAEQAKSIWDTVGPYVQPLFKHLDSPVVLILGVVLVVSGCIAVAIAEHIRANRLADHHSGVHAGPGE